MCCLHSIAEVAVLDVLTDETQNLWPPVVVGDELQYLEATGMISDFGVMVLRHNAAMQLSVFQHVDLATEEEKAIRFGPFGVVHGTTTSVFAKFTGSFGSGLLLDVVVQAVAYIGQNVMFLTY